MSKLCKICQIFMRFVKTSWGVSKILWGKKAQFLLIFGFFLFILYFKWDIGTNILIIIIFTIKYKYHANRSILAIERQIIRQRVASFDKKPKKKTTVKRFLRVFSYSLVTLLVIFSFVVVVDRLSKNLNLQNVK